jgi:hypothetical protein
VEKIEVWKKGAIWRFYDKRFGKFDRRFGKFI